MYEYKYLTYKIRLKNIILSPWINIVTIIYSMEQIRGRISAIFPEIWEVSHCIPSSFAHWHRNPLQNLKFQKKILFGTGVLKLLKPHQMQKSQPNFLSCLKNILPLLNGPFSTFLQQCVRWQKILIIRRYIMLYYNNALWIEVGSHSQYIPSYSLYYSILLHIEYNWFC